jgi:arylsulfatase A-like enzyme
VLADDLGWGDVAYNGNPVVRTPHLDKLAADGVRLDRFYAQAPSCSPTRASTLTGRNGYRFGIIRANNGRMEPGERTIAEYLSDQGYATGHFGKWHLGTLTRGEVDGKRGGTAKGEGEYAPPWENGFQVCFSTESKVPTWNPLERPNNDVDTYWAPRAPDADPSDWVSFGTSYWLGEGKAATDNLTGDDSRIIMDRALPFIEDAVKRERPFLAVIWFHAPHMPVVAGPEFAALYPECNGFEKNYFGSITALDAQVGRLRSALEAMGVWENTLLVFGSDNGPESIAHSESEPAPGSAGILRGRKRSLNEGGVRVPGIVSWPAQLEGGRASSLPFTTSDLLPSIVGLLGGTDTDAVSPVDGIDAVSLLRAGVERRSAAIPFEFVGQVALLDNNWKLYSADDGASYALFDLSTDPTESHDVAVTHPERTAAMRVKLTTWRESCRASTTGADYH